MMRANTARRRSATAMVMTVCGTVLPLLGQVPGAHAADGPAPVVYDAAGVYEYVVPAGVREIEVALVGAGGGGGGGGNAPDSVGARNDDGGGGGGGGGYVACVFPVEQGHSYRVVVGGGGGGGGTAVGAQPADGVPGRGPHGGAGGTGSAHNGADTTGWRDGSGGGGGSAFVPHVDYVRGGGGGGGGASLFGTADADLAAAPGGSGGLGALAMSGNPADDGRGGSAAEPGGVGGHWRRDFYTDGEKGGAAGTCPGLAEDQAPEAAEPGKDGARQQSGWYDRPGPGGAGGGDLPAEWTAGKGAGGGYQGAAGGTGTDGRVVITPATTPATD
ncbi:hypothetical protein [Kitasatospora purpeofusca]|uniref:hypothetical protein n=1 Tax=Kitasatospora purpeofusca TaxID=67352 RepID=UPI00365C4744